MRKVVRTVPRLARSRTQRPRAAGAAAGLGGAPYPLGAVYAQAGIAPPAPRPIEMGAIRIDLAAFKPRMRALILEKRVPLGRLLRGGGVDYRSRPALFLAVTPNPEMMGVFWMREPRPLYGRKTEMSVGGRKVGDIVEILPLVS